MTLEDVYKRLLAIQDEVTYDDLPTFEQAIGRLNKNSAARALSCSWVRCFWVIFANTTLVLFASAVSSE